MSTQSSILQGASECESHTTSAQSKNDLSQVRVTTVTNESRLPELRADWDRLVQHPNAEFEFFSLIIKLRPEVLSPCVFTLQKGGTTRAILAGRVEEAFETFRLGYLRLWNMRIRRVCFVYGGNMGVVEPDDAAKLVDAVSSLLRDKRLDYAEFSHLKQEEPLNKAVRGRRPLIIADKVRETSIHYVLNVPAKFSDFLAGIKNRRRFTKMSRGLENDFPGKVSVRRFSTQEEVREFWRDAEIIAAQTYHRQLGVGLRGDEEHRQRFELIARRGQFRGIIMYIQGKPSAFWCGTHFGNMLHLGATGYVPDFRKYELGTLLFLRLLEDCCGTEVGAFDFGFGDAPYKQRFANESWVEETVYLYAPTFRGVMINILRTFTFSVNTTVKKMSDKLGITQRVKTWWRQRLARHATAEQHPQVEAD